MGFLISPLYYAYNMFKMIESLVMVMIKRAHGNRKDNHCQLARIIGINTDFIENLYRVGRFPLFLPLLYNVAILFFFIDVLHSGVRKVFN